MSTRLLHQNPIPVQKGSKTRKKLNILKENSANVILPTRWQLILAGSDIARSGNTNFTLLDMIISKCFL